MGPNLRQSSGVANPLKMYVNHYYPHKLLMIARMHFYMYARMKDKITAGSHI